MSRIEEIKQRLERNQKWTIKTDEGYVPTVIGEYKHDDVKWLIEQAEKVEQLKENIGHLEHENNLLYGRLNNIRDLASKTID